MLSKPRQCLLHDWEQGNYVDGGILEGRIDWDGLETMEQTALDVIEWMVDEHDVWLFWSGGIDVAVVLHMCYRLDLQDDVPCITFRTPEHYPSAADYVEGMADRWGFDLTIESAEWMDIEWVADDPETRLFPRWIDKDQMYDDEYSNPAAEHQQSEGYELALTGLRNEHGKSTAYIESSRDSFTAGKPIYQWSVEHVMAYHDKHTIPIPEGYRLLTTGANHPWHRELTSAENHHYAESRRQTRTVPQCWHLVREATVKHGYTDFWTDHILDYFPEGEELAQEWAASNDLTLLSIEDGRNSGADAYEVPYSCGPGT